MFQFSWMPELSLIIYVHLKAYPLLLIHQGLLLFVKTVEEFASVVASRRRMHPQAIRQRLSAFITICLPGFIRAWIRPLDPKRKPGQNRPVAVANIYYSIDERGYG